MGWRFSIFVILVAVASAGCRGRGSRSEGSAAVSREDCEEPENPYDEGFGRFAGFNWAEEKDVGSCGGNSQSFIEGCQESSGSPSPTARA